MASSENEVRTPLPPTLEELSRRGVRSLFLPYIIGLVSESSLQLSQSPREVLVLVNFRSGSITMVEGSGQIEALLRGKEGPLPASKASIEAMPAVEVTEEGFMCAICLTEFETEGESAKEMPCKHKYHPGCIDKWLGIHGSCPICRYQMPVEEEEKNPKIGSNEEGESGGGIGGDRGSFSGAGFVFHIYVAESRRRADPDPDTIHSENENPDEDEANSGSDMDIDR